MKTIKEIALRARQETAGITNLKISTLCEDEISSAWDYDAVLVKREALG